jgi:hypothetical protein
MLEFYPLLESSKVFMTDLLTDVKKTQAEQKSEILVLNNFVNQFLKTKEASIIFPSEKTFDLKELRSFRILISPENLINHHKKLEEFFKFSKQIADNTKGVYKDFVDNILNLSVDEEKKKTLLKPLEDLRKMNNEFSKQCAIFEDNKKKLGYYSFHLILIIK